MRQVRARLEGRAGAGVLQPWRDLRKLARKQPITPRGTSEVFRTAPLLMLATTVAVVAVAPFVTIAAVPAAGADLFVVVALLALGAVALALAGLDTGTAFGGMGASREITILALVEPTLLVAIFALSVPVGSTNLADIVTSTLHDPSRAISPASLLAGVALGLAVVAETGRLPVDNPSTHLELTMVHEAMVLEYAGPDLALVELASAMRLSVFLGLWATSVRALGHRGRRRRRCARARHARLHRQGHRPGRSAGRGRGVPGQAAVVPGAGAAGRIVRPGAARGGRVVLLRLNPLPGTGVHMTARAHRTPR